MAVKIAVVNESTSVSDADVQTAVAALQIQVDRDFAPIWKRDAQLVFVPQGQANAAPLGSRRERRGSKAELKRSKHVSRKVKKAS